MGSIADSLPPHKRRKLAEIQLIPGRIVYLFSTFTTPEKEKYLVIGYWGDTPLVLAINSRINAFKQDHPELLRCQVLIRADDYDFLDHDSYIDCAKVVNSFDAADILDQLQDDLTRLKGEITEETCRQILDAISVARTVSPFHKDLIKKALAR